ncbi:MAG: Nif3-like dinuclear metal center hexameric protein [Synergistaceae bacterium]|nr:Nif3-like dinuclear metal center hexameric protein [Synergistaceae bacterium]
MKVRDLLSHIDTFAPFSLAEDWDNPGLMAGSYDAEVSRVGICLDAVSEAVIDAAENGCNVLLCHHPLIFRPLKNIDIDCEIGRTIYEALKRGVNIIAAHTNWDKADEGVNATLAELLKLSRLEPLGDFGLVGELEAKMSLKNFAEHIKSSWGLSRLDIYADTKIERVIFFVSRVALCGGSGAEFWRDAKNSGADIYLTADMKYHELIDATKAGLTIGLVNHGEMERASLPKLAEKVSLCGVQTKLIDVKALPSPLRL